MVCEKCQKRPAAVHMTKIANGTKTETNLCEVCAQEENNLSFGMDPNWMLQNIFAELFNQALVGTPPTGLLEAKPVQCEHCGFTDAKFLQIGKLGCPQCYEVFESKLEPVLRRVQGSPRHTGKIPKRTGGAISLRKEIEELKQRLQTSINREEYEMAAEVRDKIRNLENLLHREGD